ncbi:DUF982 domain-containing protein [Allomesorhizobium alhagi]|uniref:DUF982 domain-containing protein n=1 Tax=Allomesorhizobium alhagi TaxID=475067 RepID=UPI000A2F3930
MKQIRFDRPICISFGKAGKTRLVHTVWEATKCLANDKWPDRAGPMWEMAVGALRGAVQGQVSAEEARQAFADAALEARILAEPDFPSRTHHPQATSSSSRSSLPSKSRSSPGGGAATSRGSSPVPE